MTQVSGRLSTTALFREMPPETLRLLATNITSVTFPANRTLMAVDQPGDAVYLILQGTVKVHVSETGGEEVVLAILGPGEVVGEMSLLDGAGRSATVTALDSTECLRMGHAAFDEAMRTIPLVAYNFARILAARIRLANEHTRALAALDVEHRIARQITAFANRYGERQEDGSIHIPIRLTQSDLSSMIGASREQTNRVLASYRTRGFLSVDPNLRITILKPEMLIKLSAGR